MPVTFKREGGEIPVERDVCSFGEESIEGFLSVHVQCVTNKGNYVDLVFCGTEKNAFSLIQTSETATELEIDHASSEEEKAVRSKFSANLAFDFSVLQYRYMRTKETTDA